MIQSKGTCCELKTMCGLSLWQGVNFVGITTIVISSVILITSCVGLHRMINSDSPYNKDPVLAINILFVLVATCVSSYQIIISAVLLWSIFKNEDVNMYYCSVWYVSHLSILVLYCVLFTARTIITIIAKKYLAAVFTMVAGCVYKAIFIYFAIVVNSYLHSVEAERYIM